MSLALLMLLGCGLPAFEPPEDAERFDKQVAPLVVRHCVACHNSSDPKGALDLTQRQTALDGGDSGPALVPGNAADSLLVERVKAVLRRAAPKDPTAAPKETDAKALDRGLLRMDPERHTCTWKNEAVTLTVTEFLILQALATRPGVVKSRNALMDAAYDDQVYVDDRTIDSHIKRLRRKFRQVDGEFKAIETLYGVGYRFAEE